MKTSFKVIKNIFLWLALLAFSFSASQAYALGSTPVKVVNSEEIAKAQGIQHPFQTTIFCEMSGNSYCNGYYYVPENKRLVIEFITIRLNLDKGVFFDSGGINTSVEGNNVTHNLIQYNPNPYGRIENSQVTRIYADPGTTLAVVASSGYASHFGGIFTISGQLIDVP